MRIKSEYQVSWLFSLSFLIFQLETQNFASFAGRDTVIGCTIHKEMIYSSSIINMLHNWQVRSLAPNLLKLLEWKSLTNLEIALLRQNAKAYPPIKNFAFRNVQKSCAVIIDNIFDPKIVSVSLYLLPFLRSVQINIFFLNLILLVWRHFEL